MMAQHFDQSRGRESLMKKAIAIIGLIIAATLLASGQTVANKQVEEA